MNYRNRKFAYKAALIALCANLGVALPAFAAAPAECVSATYVCTTNGYEGVDPYGYYNYSFKDAAGRLHKCTAYAAYQISIFTPYDSRYSHLGDASQWATGAANTGLTVSTTPSVRDIAQWDYGHVAFVEDVVYFASGRVAYIVTTSDNAGVNSISNRVTRRSVLYPSQNNYPDHFTTFPEGGGGGSKPAINLLQAPIGG